MVKLDLQGNWLWQRALGGSGHDILYGLAVAPTGGFAAVGVRDKATPVTAGDGWLVRLDKSGNTVSETTLKAGGDDVLRMIGWSRLSHAAKSGGWLAAGTQVIEHIGDPNWSSNYDRSQGWVVRVDDKLQVQWQGTLDYYAVETLRGGTVLRDGDLFVAGDTRGGSPIEPYAPTDKPDGLALRVDGLTGEDSCECGFFERADTASAAPSRLEDVVALPTNTVVAAGWQTATNGLGDGWLQASASDGKPTWSKTYGKAGDDRFSALTADGDGWLLVGFTTSSGAGGKDGWVVRTDGFGTKLIEITLGGPDDDELIDVLKLPNGNWLGVGRSKNQSKGGYDGWAISFKSSGAVVWEIRLGSKYDDALTSATVLGGATDWRIVAVGYQLFSTGPNPTGWVVNLQPGGAVAVDLAGKPMDIAVGSDGSPALGGHQNLQAVTRLTDGSAVAVGRSCMTLQCGGWWVHISPQGAVGKEVILHAGFPVGQLRTVLAESGGGFAAFGDGCDFTGLHTGGTCAWSLRVKADDKIVGKVFNYNQVHGKFGWDMGIAAAARLPNGHYYLVGHGQAVAKGPLLGWALRTDALLYSGYMNFNNRAFDGNCKHQLCGQWMVAHVKNGHDACEDDNECTVGDSCTLGQCKHWSLNTCDDGNPCTEDLCHAGPGCWYAPAGEGKSCGAASTQCAAGNCGLCPELISGISGLAGHDGYHAASAANGGGWWVTGSSHKTWPTDNQPADAWAGKLDAAGKLTMHYQPDYAAGNDRLEALVAMADGTVWLGGWVEPKAGERDNWLVHLAADGKVLSDAKPVVPKYQSTAAARPSKAGWLFSGCKDNLAWVGERDAAGKTLWEATSAAVAGGTEIAYGVGGDVTATADGTIWLQIAGSQTVGSHFDNSIAFGTAAGTWKANYVYSTSFGGYGRLLAQPDNTVIDIRPYWNGGTWIVRWQRLQKPFKVLATVSLPTVTYQVALDTLQLGNGDLVIAGTGYKTSGAEFGATVWRVTVDGTTVWSQAPATASTGQSQFRRILFGPKNGQVTAFGFTAPNPNPTLGDGWVRVLETGGKLFCNGTQN